MDNFEDLDKVLDQFEQEADRLIGQTTVAVRKSDDNELPVASALSQETAIGYAQTSAPPSISVFSQLPDLLGDGHSPMRDAEPPNGAALKAQIVTVQHPSTNGVVHEAPVSKNSNRTQAAPTLTLEEVDAYLGFTQNVVVSSPQPPPVLATEQPVPILEPKPPSFPSLPVAGQMPNQSVQSTLPVTATFAMPAAATTNGEHDVTASARPGATQPIKRLGDFRPPKRPTTLLGLSKPVLPSDELRSANAVESQRSFAPHSAWPHAQTGPALPNASLAYDQTAFFLPSAPIAHPPAPTVSVEVASPPPASVSSVPRPEPPDYATACASAPTESAANTRAALQPPKEEPPPVAPESAAPAPPAPEPPAPRQIMHVEPVPNLVSDPAPSDVPTGILIDLGNEPLVPVPSSSTVQPPVAAVQPVVGEWHVGSVKPTWIPDSDAAVCMLCAARFTFTRRRHHCRACGKVFCASCCSQRYPLAYLNGKSDRVCAICFKLLTTADSARSDGSAFPPPLPTSPTRTPTDAPSSASTSTDTILRASSPAALATYGASTPVTGAPERAIRKRSEPKRVTFSDGMRPGIEEASDARPTRDAQPAEPAHQLQSEVQHDAPVARAAGAPGRRSLPALACSEVREDGETVWKSTPFQDETELVHFLVAIAKSSGAQQAAEPLRFALNSEVQILLRFDSLDCCVQKLCWSFCSDGLRTFGEPELIVLLECSETELRVFDSDCEPSRAEASALTDVLLDVVDLYNTVFNEFAQTGRVHSELEVLVVDRQFLGSRQHGGWLLVRPTFQCTRNLPIPSSTETYLVALLVHRLEISWAKLFPLRLLLRLGAEFKYYPCPLHSVRERPSVYGDLGHTVLSLFCDFQNFAYALPRLAGASVQIENNRCTVRLPRSQREVVRRLLDSCQDGEHVIALGACFNEAVDSHLVAVQNVEGSSYFTQAITVQNRQKKVAGASFVVFSGAYKQPDCTNLRVPSPENAPLQNANQSVIEQLKTVENVQVVTSNGHARWSIVEDGVLVQFTADTFGTLRDCLKAAQSVLFVASGSPSPTDSNTPSPQDDSIAHSFAQSGSSLLAVHLAHAHSTQTLAIVWFD